MVARLIKKNQYILKNMAVGTMKKPVKHTRDSDSSRDCVGAGGTAQWENHLLSQIHSRHISARRTWRPAYHPSSWETDGGFPDKQAE